MTAGAAFRLPTGSQAAGDTVQCWLPAALAAAASLACRIKTYLFFIAE